ncbi:hypothetical protein VMCG_05607 [Cytospora schulzeri]|uniref:dTMP kinase n=1 Tax=Cytospora schulzeri TaxID=448051 RepID=A0A423WEV3_9PEZI|nr:hypothetical protein VMCG_05607 [Valsa malicola]
MSEPTENNHDLAAAVAEINRTAAAAATPVLTTVGDATADSTASATTTGAQAQAQPSGKGKGRGAFIVLEGLDRSGKTTQVKLLQSRLVEAGRGIINQYLSSSTTLPDQSIHLLFTANRWEAAPAISALLEGGTTIVCDRYYYSGMVYSAAKDNPSLTLPWARSPEVGLPRPDMVVFLDLSEDKAAERGGFGEERYETGAMQRRVRSLFWGLKEGVVVDGVRFGEESEDLVVVDAGRSVEEVAEDIWGVVGPRVDEVERGDKGAEVRKVS